MAEGFVPGALLARYYALPRGPRVCLRLARPRDHEGVLELLAAQGIEPSELQLARLVYFDLSERLVLCATALIGACERVVGVGVIELTSDADPAPTLVAVDDELTGGLADLLRDALVGQAAAIGRARAA
jgi:hypothetical protein